MGRRRLLWQLFPTYLFITFVSLGAVTWYMSGALRSFHIEQTALDLEARGHLIEHQLRGHLLPSESAYIDTLCKELGRESKARITVILPDGTVLGDTEEDPGRMDNHAGRPEIILALKGRVGVSTRFSHTLQKEMLYVAVAVVEGKAIVGSVRVSIPATAIDRTLESVYLRLGWAGLVIALVAAALSLVVARRITRLLEEMKRGAQRFARGELGRRLPISRTEEIGALGVALNEMAAQLDERIRTMASQRNELEAVLGSMVEGVLAVDAEARILRLNQAASRLMGIEVTGATGRRIQEVVRKTDLQRFVTRLLESREPVEGDIVLQFGGVERFLQAHGTPLRDAQGREIGALIVLNDVTRLRRLENIRRDFVANVSHELRTPITAIKGSVETLMAGAVENHQDAQRFLGIACRQADRLNAIIEDLLALSRVEQEAEREGIPLQFEALKPVLEAALQVCQQSAEEKPVRVNLFCHPDLQARINAPLLEQAVVNLLTNAIKYSSPEGTVLVEAARFQSQVMIKVQDWGCGIAREHLPRLFERFYRVDPARSRNLGGTGLGLAIVKHIAQSHGGEVVVNSTPGQGSSFTITLPAPVDASGGR